MLDLVTSGLGTVVGWCGTVVTALFGQTGQLATLAPMVAIGVAVSALLLGAKVIKQFAWGV